MNRAERTSINLNKIKGEHSKGKVNLKYAIQVPLILNKKRRRIEFIVVSFTYAFVFVFAPFIIDYFNPTINRILVFLIFISPFPFLYLFLKKYLFRVKNIGLVRFLDDSIQIETDDVSEIVYYSEIKGIYYRYNVIDSVMSRNPIPKTVFLEIGRFNKRHLFLEVSYELFLTESDLLEFKRLSPSLLFVLDNVSSKFGTVMKNKLKIPLELDGAKGHNLNKH